MSTGVRITNIHQAAWHESSEGERFQRGHIALTGVDNDTGIGCSAYRVEPGKRAFPRHAHLANDEAIFVVSGTGVLEVDDDALHVVAGDFVLLPRGSEYPHVLVNDSESDLVYLCISTMNMPDVVHYPDSNKLGVLETRFWTSEGGQGRVNGFFTHKEAGYWDGEDTGAGSD